MSETKSAVYLCVSLNFLCVFAMKLKLGDSALRIEVNTDAVKPPSSAANVYSSLQEYITKLQVKWPHTAGYFQFIHFNIG